MTLQEINSPERMQATLDSIANQDIFKITYTKPNGVSSARYRNTSQGAEKIAAGLIAKGYTGVTITEKIGQKTTPSKPRYVWAGQEPKQTAAPEQEPAPQKPTTIESNDRQDASQAAQTALKQGPKPSLSKLRITRPKH